MRAGAQVMQTRKRVSARLSLVQQKGLNNVPRQITNQGRALSSVEMATWLGLFGSRLRMRMFQ